MMKCCVFASGSGSNFQSLIDRSRSGDLHVELTLCISNNASAYSLQRARENDIKTFTLSPSRFPSEDDYATRLRSILTDHEIDCCVLAGYMKKIPASVVGLYKNRILNIHPALLPSFGGKGMFGMHVHRAVLAYGAKITGVTIHFVDEEYDHGPVILQKPVPVLDTDTPESLAQRVLAVEHQTYWRALEALAQQNVTVEGRRCRGDV